MKGDVEGPVNGGQAYLEALALRNDRQGRCKRIDYFTLGFKDGKVDRGGRISQFLIALTTTQGPRHSLRQYSVYSEEMETATSVGRSMTIQ